MHDFIFARFRLSVWQSNALHDEDHHLNKCSPSRVKKFTNAFHFSSRDANQKRIAFSTSCKLESLFIFLEMPILTHHWWNESWTKASHSIICLMQFPLRTSIRWTLETQDYSDYASRNIERRFIGISSNIKPTETIFVVVFWIEDAFICENSMRICLIRDVNSRFVSDPEIWKNLWKLIRQTLVSLLSRDSKNI